MTGFPSSYDSLVALDNEQFLRTAYEMVLGRPADPAGIGYYGARLDAGFSKLSVLLQLRHSGEWNSDHGISGLNRVLAHYRFGRMPLVGWIFRSIWKVEGESVAERLQRQIINRIAAMQFDLRAGAGVAGPGQPVARAPFNSPSPHRRNLVAEQLSPRAREIFDRLTSS